jgi:hypothetical protein
MIKIEGFYFIKGLLGCQEFQLTSFLLNDLTYMS